MMKGFILLLLLFSLASAGLAQNDSLWTIWNDQRQPDSTRLKALQTLSWKAVFERPDSGIALARSQLALAEKANIPLAKYEAHTTLAVGSSIKSDHGEALAQFDQCLVIARAMGDRKREANTYSNVSNVFRSIGDLPAALEALRKSEAIDLELSNREGLAGTYNNLGNLYSELGDTDKALESYRQSAALARELDSPRGGAQAMQNIGTIWLQLGLLDTALVAFHQAMDLYRTMGRKLEMGMTCNNLGRAYGLIGREERAHVYLDSAALFLSEVGSDRNLARTFLNRGQLHLRQGQGQLAINACEKGAEIARNGAMLQQEKECQQCLAEAYAAAGNHRKAYLAQQIFIQLNDSLLALNNGKEVTRLDVTRGFQLRMFADSLSNERERFEQEFAYQAQLGKERDRRNLSIYASIGVLLLAGGLWNRLQHIRRSRTAIHIEKERSENLLLNILPKAIAEELKERGEAEARLMEQVTVLFTDFKGFTALSEQLAPKDLVKDIHQCFSAFDRICEKHGVEKIKTIGDAYMAAGGLPMPNGTHAVDVVRAALEMRDFIAQGKERKVAQGLPAFEIRIGVHTGPVVAGIVGIRKFQYDIWGDTVNTASRMESSGQAGAVNISEATYALVKDAKQERSEALEFTFTPRGKVQAKGKGELEMFFVERATEGIRSSFHPSA